MSHDPPSPFLKGNPSITTAKESDLGFVFLI
jgi:hypothetical protein